MTTYVFTLEPDTDLNNRIVALKKEIRIIAGEQQYLRDSPHITLYLSNFEDNIVEEIIFLASKIKKTKITTKKWVIFRNDLMTGKDTLAVDIEGITTKLNSIQKTVVDRLSILRNKEFAERYEAVYDNLGAEMKQNLEKYGFPFVGEIWKPHITLAAIEKGKFVEVMKKIEDKCPVGRFELKFFTVFTLKGETLQMFKKIELK